MKYLILALAILTSTSQANLGTFDSNGRFIFPDTNKPYTGNLDVINNDWGKNAVEINKNFINGILHGTERSYYQSGKLRSTGSFKHGILDGIVTGYHEDGSIQVRAVYDNGVKQGRVVYYYSNGNKQVEQHYTDNVLDGLYKTWYENGKLMESIPYSKGLVHGVLETYYETGGIFERVKYDYGTPKYITTHNEDGGIAEQKGFIDKELIERIIG